jgi:hypothetical protein
MIPGSTFTRWGEGLAGMCSNMVETQSGYTYAERPVALHWEGERLPIAAIETRWRDPSGRGYRVRAEDGRIFDLYYDETSNEWTAGPR